VSLATERVGDGVVYVVHAFLAPADYRGAAIAEDMLARTTRHGRELLDRLPAECPSLAGVRWEPELLAGPPATAITEVAAVRQADEIIVGTRGFGRMRALLGSVAHEVIHLAECPVTVIPERVAERTTAAPTTAAAAAAP
jgi:nucleotide-binding universal stress UspA family protein